MFLIVLLSLLATAGAADAGPTAQMRLGLVKFGAMAWEIETMRRQMAAERGDLGLEIVDLANPAAGEVALQAGRVDAIMTDWLWIARQRYAGQKLTFVPHNALLGDLLVPPDSPARSLADLEGKRIGVAGGPLDKSWLLLRAYSLRQFGHDVGARAQPVFAAPPLLSQEIAAGRLDAVLTFWPYAARLSLQGYRSLLALSDVMAGLGVGEPAPMLGFGLSEGWIAAHPGALPGFLAALRRADAELALSDQTWQSLRPLTGAESDAVLVALRDRFRQGLVEHWSEGDLDKAATLLAVLSKTAGAELTGGAVTLPAGTFWRGAAP
jgi:NitT/TauT family transport system substrate-binding protein